MKALKIIGISLLSLIGLYCIWAAVSPAKPELSKSIEVSKDKNTCYAIVLDFNEYLKWNPWSKMDPTGTHKITGTGKDLGDMWMWKGQEIGEGSLTHTETKPGEMILNTLEFKAPFVGTSQDVFKFEEKDGKTMITWSNISDAEVPFFARPIMPIMMGGQFKKGLADLKALIESSPAIALAPEIKIEEKDVPAMIAITEKTSCTDAEIGAKLATCYGNISKCIDHCRIEPVGAPFAIYHSYSPEKVDMEAGIPVTAKAKHTMANLTCIEMPACRAVVAHYYGPYEGSGNAHKKIDQYIAEHKLTQAGSPWEVYVTDPTTVKSPNDVLTDVYYPVK